MNKEQLTQKIKEAFYFYPISVYYDLLFGIESVTEPDKDIAVYRINQIKLLNKKEFNSQELSLIDNVIEFIKSNNTIK